MPTRNSTQLGAPVWIDLFTSDTDAIKRFYGELLGWTSEDGGEEYGGYINFSSNGALVAGCMHNDGSMGSPDHWTVYLASADAAATVAAAEANGATVVVPAMAVMDLGSMAVLSDPGGAGIGVWQPGAHTGFGVTEEPGAPSWFELHTNAYDTEVAFYQEVFGWATDTVSDSPEFRYTTLGSGDDQAAGIMDASGFLGGASPYWAVYFDVADVDASCAQAIELGGAVTTAAMDTPYGRIATLTDPTGSDFRLRQPN